MPAFRYTVIDPTGKRISQTMNASNKREVATFLAKNNYFIVAINEKTAKGLLKGSQKISPKDKIFFTQNVSVLLASGVSLGEAISIIAEDANSKSMTVFCSALQDELEKGTPLSKALSLYPDNFDSVYISLVNAGENSGQLDVVMNNLAKGMQKDIRTIQQVKSALLYPAFVLASLFVLGLIVVFFVLPKISTIFEQLNVSLPITTRALIAFSKFTSAHPILILASLIIGGIATVLYFRSRWSKKLIGILASRLPVLKKIIFHLDLLRLSSTLSLLLNAGLPIQEAIKIAASTIKNPRLQQQFETVTPKLASGRSLGQVLHEVTLPKTFISLVAVGERSGNIATIFASLAEHYEDLLDTSIKDFTGIIEPVLTLFVGLMVAGVIASVMVPLYSFIGSINSLN